MYGGGRRFESVRGLRVFSCLAAVSVVYGGGGGGLRCPRSVHTVDVALDCIAVAIEAGLTASV